jgi:hypothetical protein
MARRNTLLAGAILIGTIIAGIVVGGLASISILPSDIKIVPPDQPLPEMVKSLSGKWYGKWAWFGGASKRRNVGQIGWECLIIVEKLDKESAQLVNAWGEYQTSNGTCHCAPDWRRIEKAKVTYSEGKASIGSCSTGIISSYPSNIQTRGLPPKTHLTEDPPDNAENFEGMARIISSYPQLFRP